MKRLMHCSVVIALIGLAGAQPLQAQDGGVGGFLDWINKMSGPRMIGPAVSGWFGVGEVVRIRGSVSRRSSSTSSAAVMPPGSQISMWSFQPTIEARISAPLVVGGGIAIHNFGGDADSFTKTSFPLYVQARFPTGSSIQGVATLGTHAFPEFATADFAPLTVDVSRDGAEFVLWFTLGVEYVWN